MAMGTRAVRVLVVDDSALMRRMISDLVEQEPSFGVVGTAANGQEALAKVAALKPDVITLDIEMPVMDGLAALENIMRDNPTPVVMLSSRTQNGAQETIRCLELGAVDFVCKPSGSISLDIERVKLMLHSKIRLAAGVKLSQSARPAVARRENPPVAQAHANTRFPAKQIIAIGSSTGGPKALEEIIPKLPADLPAGVVVVQHMPPGFTAAMAERFNHLSAVEVREAKDGDVITRGTVLIAPGGKHLLVGTRGQVRTSDDPPVWGVRPAVDLMMTSAVEMFGHSIIGVLLTGMGQDGARGMAAIRKAGGPTIAQDEASCVVYGMPKAAVEAGAVDITLPLNQIAEKLTRMLPASKDKPEGDCAVAGGRVER
jgi:two-component system, chemotaxis family, protein-glutamate methylesterase/glutaminase